MTDATRQDAQPFEAMLARLAPGTELRRGVESILAAGNGALIVVGADEAVTPLIDGGFHLDCPFSAARLYELCKMDGAVLVTADLSRIRYANVQLQPDSRLPSAETGTRHRTAERVASQTGGLVIAVSQRRRAISVYQGERRQVLADPVMLLARANQALATLTEQRARLDESLRLLSALEFRGRVTAYDVARVLQRFGLIDRVAREVARAALELGTEGGLVDVQLAHLTEGLADAEVLVIRDYLRVPEEVPTRLPTRSEAHQARQRLAVDAAEGSLDALVAARVLGVAGTASELEAPATPRGLRQLDRVPRLPAVIAERLVTRFGSLAGVLAADISELDAVEGVGESRARGVLQALARLRAEATARRRGA